MFDQEVDFLGQDFLGQEFQGQEFQGQESTGPAIREEGIQLNIDAEYSYDAASRFLYTEHSSSSSIFAN